MLAPVLSIVIFSAVPFCLIALRKKPRTAAFARDQGRCHDCGRTCRDRDFARPVSRTKLLKSEDPSRGAQTYATRRKCEHEQYANIHKRFVDFGDARALDSDYSTRGFPL